MMEKIKSVILALLVALSLVQSYFLAYSMPSLEAKVRSNQNYVQTEPLGPEEEVKNLLFPEMIVLHRGEDWHTVFFPSDAPYYNLILTKLQGREFKGFQRNAAEAIDWEQVRREDQGLELRFSRPIPFELLQQVLKIDEDFLFFGDSIDRIWIFVRKGTEEVRTFFFSADGRSVYESQRADLTFGDVTTNVGFGEFWTPFQTADGRLYLPEKNYNKVVELDVSYSRYTIEQMQRNLFFDPGTTRAIPERKDGSLIYTDGKRGLKVVENGGWMSFSDQVVPTEGRNDLIDNVTGAVRFVNQHGGWNGQHLLTLPDDERDTVGVIRFRQYYNHMPVLSSPGMTFGHMQLRLQQGTVTFYERSLINLEEAPVKRRSRELPGGDALRQLIQMAKFDSPAVALFPAYRPSLEKDIITLHPVWAVRLENGNVQIVSESSPAP
jgi:regulatory protein YycH of two-component signal transduction system YycFG